MSAEQYTPIEQDPQGTTVGGNELPTYDDLANQNGPNSRFGRWRGWIEKRAAERYADITPEERERRRERGWDLQQSAPTIPQLDQESSAYVGAPVVVPPRGASLPLHIQTEYLSMKESPPQTRDDTSTVVPSLPFVSQTIAPSHLKINHFGSRFLPHTTSQIRCVLSLMVGRMLLVGHDEGLSVLDMFPQEWNEHGDIITKGPDEAQCRLIWRGETIFQMSILETEDIGNGTPQGVVLAIVGPSQNSTNGKEAESTRVARMYSLSSLISLARWTVANKGSKPLDLHRMTTWQSSSTPSKRHKAQGSIARGIKSLIDTPQSHHAQPEPTTSQQGFLSPTNSANPGLSTTTLSPSSRKSPTSRRSSGESSWNVVEDLPLRWATDFVPLAVPGSRLVGATVVTFATWSDDSRKGRMGGQLLAIATKTNILLYETPKGERAYRFVKEFYTPLQPRQITFIQQIVNDVRSPMENSSSGRFHSHKRSDSGNTPKHTNAPSSSAPLSYGTHLSLFVVFDKKAGLIRLADSAVGEVELGEDGGPQPSSGLFPRDTFSSTISATSLRQRARLSFDIRESTAKWGLPIRCELPVPNRMGFTQPVHILTKGKRTHIVPCPLPPRLSGTSPLHAVFWKSTPKHVSPRVIHSHGDPLEEPPLLQLVAFGEGGIEIQEVGLSFMVNNGKGRAFPEEQVRAEEDVGDAGFLTMGGNWDRVEQMYGPSNVQSASSVFSVDTMDSTDLLGRLKRDEGIYGWCRKGMEDWRVFWVGGDQEPVLDPADDSYYSGDIYD